MKKIKLTQNKCALVSGRDFDLNQYRWYAHKRPRTFYAVWQGPRIDKKQKNNFYA